MASLLEEWGFFRRPPDSRPPREIEGDILDELRFHVEQRTDDLIAEGRTPEEARAEARRRFGDFESVRAACRRAQMGERVLLQRINLVLLVVLVVGLVVVGWGGIQSRKHARVSMELARAEMAHVHARLDEVAQVLRDAPAIDPGSVEALRALGLELPGREPVEESGPPSEEEVQRWIGRFHEQPESWRHGLALADEIAGLPPDRALALMEAIWPHLPVPHREQAFKPFVFHGGHVHAVSILHLGATDPEPTVRGRAFEYLKQYAFRDFSGDPDAYYEWGTRFLGRSLDEVLRENAAAMVGRLALLDGEALARELRALERPDLRNGAVADLDLAAVFRGSGAVDLARGWLLEGSPDAQQVALRWLRELEVDEETQRALVLPVIHGTGDFDRGVVAEACRALGRRGNAWAVEPLLDHAMRALESPNQSRHSDVWSVGRALAEIGDARAVPTLIGMIAADDSYETVYGLGWFALKDLTGVYYDESHDGAWWIDWWSRNRHDMPTDVRGLEIPSFRFERQER